MKNIREYNFVRISGQNGQDLRLKASQCTESLKQNKKVTGPDSLFVQKRIPLKMKNKLDIEIHRMA